MKSLVSILSALLDDASRSLGADTTRDRETILDRIEHEGDAFLYITLPEFGSWLEQSLESGQALPTIHSIFRKRPKGSMKVLPCFLHGLTRLVFDENTGRAIHPSELSSSVQDNRHLAVYFIRQICYLFKKPKALASSKRIKKAIAQYRETDDSVFSYADIKSTFNKTSLNDVPLSYHMGRERVKSLLDSGDENFQNQFALSFVNAVCSRILPKLEQRYLEARALVFPKHGPGATADRLRGNQKFKCRDWYERWDGIFHHEELYGFPIELEEDLNVVYKEKELPVRVIPVPKTYKTSRIISIEPTGMQYAQQLVMAKMVYAIERTELRNVIKFTDQSQNRGLACQGSFSPYAFSTIDLSEASDRVGAALVHFLLKKHCPSLCRELFAVRSRYAKLPDSRFLLPIKKYASMGSATTFPVESLIFAILAIAATSATYWKQGLGSGRNPDRAVRSYNMDIALQTVSVFGDDIICPRDSFSEVCQYLSLFGLKVNARKSFAQGPFKESCGGDYYEGVDVTPAYCRTAAPGRRSDAERLSSFVSLSNQLYLKGCWLAAEEVRNQVELILGQLPLKRRTAGYLGWETFQNATQYRGFDKNFSPWVVSWVLKTRFVRDDIDEYSALLKHFISKEVQEQADHLEQSVAKHSVRLQRRRVPAH